MKPFFDDAETWSSTTSLPDPTVSSVLPLLLRLRDAGALGCEVDGDALVAPGREPIALARVAYLGYVAMLAAESLQARGDSEAGTRLGEAALILGWNLATARGATMTHAGLARGLLYADGIDTLISAGGTPARATELASVRSRIQAANAAHAKACPGQDKVPLPTAARDPAQPQG